MSQPFNMRANGNIIRSRFVMLDPTAPAPGTSSGNNVIQATLNAKCEGIADIAGGTAPIPTVTQSPPYAAQAGQNVRVHSLGAVCNLEAGSGGYQAGDELQSDANGAGVAVTIDGKGRVGAVAISGANAGELGVVQVVRYDKTGAPS